MSTLKCFIVTRRKRLRQKRRLATGGPSSTGVRAWSPSRRRIGFGVRGGICVAAAFGGGGGAQAAVLFWCWRGWGRIRPGSAG